MHKYFYQICAVTINEKYNVRKIIYNNFNNYITHENIKFNNNQIDKLLKNLDSNEYSIVDINVFNNLPPKKLEENNNDIDDFEKKNLDNFRTGNFSYP